MSHFTVEHGDSLTFSPNPVIQRLIEAGWEVHPTFAQYFMAIPRNGLTLGEPFVMEERHEFEISIKNVGLLRFRFETPTRCYLTLFMVDREKQGKGLGRVWFPRVIAALFRAGVKFVWGRVEPPFYRAAWPMDQERLIRFYEKNGFKNIGDERIWMSSPYRATNAPCIGGTTPPSESETTAVLQS